MDEDLIKDRLYELIDQFTERKINHKNLYFALLDNLNRFYDGRTCKMLFASSFNEGL